MPCTGLSGSGLSTLVKAKINPGYLERFPAHWEASQSAKIWETFDRKRGGRQGDGSDLQALSCKVPGQTEFNYFRGMPQGWARLFCAIMANFFNALDFFVRNSQKGHTRGVLVGPDAYRLIAEFVLSRIDRELNELVGSIVVGAVRHVDDYYIGLRTEHDAQSVLSHLREILATYELSLNDQKTKIYSSLEPINDLWAQRLRDHTDEFRSAIEYDVLERGISESVDAANRIGSDSPIKILLRSLDESRVYISVQWDYVEQNLQRIVQKHPHAIDYACLLVAKRMAIGREIDVVGWLAVAEIVLKRTLALNHHHEALWMVWLLIVCGIELPAAIVDELSKSRNAHIRALLVQASVDGTLTKKPKLGLGASLSSVDSSWLVNLVARSQGFSGAPFSGLYSDEFQHLAGHRIKLIDFKDHLRRVEKQNKRAISRTRYGYDDDDDLDLDELFGQDGDDNPF